MTLLLQLQCLDEVDASTPSHMQFPMQTHAVYTYQCRLMREMLQQSTRSKANPSCAHNLPSKAREEGRYAAIMQVFRLQISPCSGNMRGISAHLHSASWFDLPTQKVTGLVQAFCSLLISHIASSPGFPATFFMKLGSLGTRQDHAMQRRAG